jgi:type II secretory pathway pseudopilin PulG
MPRRPPPLHRDESGIGLVELLVVILIMGVVGGMTVTSLVQGMRTSSRVDARIQTSTDLQRAAERVARDLRRGVWTDISMVTPPAEPDGCTYVSLEPDDLTLIVFDGSDRYRHVYTHASGALSLDIDQWVAGAWADVSDQVVIDGLNNATAATPVPVFSFLDRDGVDLLDDGLDASDRSSVRNFRLTLVGTVTDQPDITLSTTVAARNGGLTCPVAS